MPPTRIPMGTLYDAMGVEITPTPPPVFGGAQSVPDGMDYGPNDRYRGYLSANITPQRIAGILRAADSGDPHDLFELCEEVLEKDPKLASVHNTRVGAIRGLNRDFLPPELETGSEADKQAADEIARFVCYSFDQTNFNELITDGMDAISKPFSMVWIEWGFDSDGRVVPSRFRRVPGTHVRWAVKTDTVRIFNPAENPQIRDGELGELVPPNSTVRFLYNSRREHPTRAGLLRSVLYLFSFKMIAMKDLAVYVDRYGMPTRIAKLPVDLWNDESFRANIRAALKTIGSDGSGVITDNMELEILNAVAQGAGPDVFQALIDIVNREYGQLYLGHELSSQSSPGQGQNGVTVADRVRQDILEGDCQWFAEIIDRDLIKPMVEFNFGPQFLYLRPTLWFDYEPPRDLMGQANVIKTLAASFPDLEFSESQMRDEFGIDRPIGSPDPEDDILKPGSGASQQATQDPNDATPPAPGDQRQTVNAATLPRVYARKGRRGRAVRLPKYSRERVDRVSRAAALGVQRVQGTMQQFEREIAHALRGLVAAGVTDVDEVRKRLIAVYPKLDTSGFREELRQKLILTRLAGRQGG